MTKHVLGAALAAVLVATAPHAALAWKPTTHVYFAERAIDDALKNGKVTIESVDHDTGVVTGKIGEYSVDSQVLSAIRSYPSHYRAGVLGPDAYPDILTGQQSIHPEQKDSGVKGGSDTWLQYIWESQNFSRNSNFQRLLKLLRIKVDTRAYKAFVTGFLTHAAGDMYGHTFINNFAGGPFTFSPPTNAIKHVVLEGYVDKRLPKDELKGDFFGASIKGIEFLIYHYMVDARPGTELDRTLLREGAGGTTYSVPRIFSTIRANLAREIKKFDDKIRDFDSRYDKCKLTDFSCSKVAIKAEKTAYQALHGVPHLYRKAWIKDVDTGLAKWPSISHEVAKALFFNSKRTADTAKAEKILKDYAVIHMSSMAGAPDFVGLTAHAVGKIVDAMTPKFLTEPIRKLKEDTLNALLKAAIGMDKTQLKNYLNNPQNYFNSVMGSGAGEKVSLATFNAKYLKIADKGYSNPNEAFDYRKFAAAHNTVTISKLILLSPSELGRLLRDLGAKSTSSGDNVMLGFMRTLDGSNQWQHGMPVARDCAAYRKIFMRQAGDDGKCAGPTPVAGGSGSTGGKPAAATKWAAAAGGRLPKGAFIGGKEPGRELPVCRAAYRNGVHPGKVVAGKCNFGWGGKEIVLTKYEVLLADAKALGWAAAGRRLPPRTFIGGKEPGRQLPICRAAYRKGVHPGKVVAGKCNIGWGGKEVVLTKYEVLVRAR